MVLVYTWKGVFYVCECSVLLLPCIPWHVRDTRIHVNTPYIKSLT